MDSVESEDGHFVYMKKKIKKIFEKAQEQFRHQALVEKCKILYRKYDNENEFLEEFKNNLRYCFVFPDKLAADNVLSFVAKFIIFLYAIETDNDNFEASDTINESCMFPTGILEFLFKSHGASNTEVRVRCLHLLNKILSGMPENSTISDSIWIKLKETVLCRIQDKSPIVRAQAVLTARKLQDPKNPNCEIIKAFIFHLNDPSSAVRRSIVSSVAFSKFTIGHVLSRTRDVNENVRRNTYIIFSKVRVLNLTTKYRLTILERGLQDRSARVRNCVQSILLVNWLENFNMDVLKFLEALDVVNYREISLKIVDNIFKVRPVFEILKSLPFDEEKRTIPIKQLTPEIALLWRATAHHLYYGKNEEELDNVLPNITVFCDYIRSFYPLEKSNVLNLNHEEKWEEIKSKEILNHLLELIKVFDFGDELGRLNLKKLIFDMLISPRIDNNTAICLIQLLVPVVPTPEMFLHEVTEVISELREPLVVEKFDLTEHKKLELEVNVSNLKVILNDLREKECNFVSQKDYRSAQDMKDEIEKIELELKNLTGQVHISQEVREEKNDPVTVCKCLTILLEMIKCSKVQTLTPPLRSIKENFLKQCLTSQDLLTQSLAVQALGQFCVLDVETARENLFRFILMLSENGDDEINGPALKSVFDILLTHGIKPFEKLHSCEDQNQHESEKQIQTLLVNNEDLFYCKEPEEINFSRDAKFIPILVELLNCKSNDVLKSIAFEGLCKLLLSGDIYCSSLLRKIIICGFSPIIDNEYEDYIRQIFMVFFPTFASSTPRSQEMIEAAFMPTLRSLIQAPLGTPEADINVKDVALFLIEYTKHDVNKHTYMTLHVHNNLALSICHEILKEVSNFSETGVLQMYFKSLMQLKLMLSEEPLANQIRVLTNKIEEETDDKVLLKLLNEFRKKIDDCCQNISVSNGNGPSSVICSAKKTKVDQISPSSINQTTRKRNGIPLADILPEKVSSDYNDKSEEVNESLESIESVSSRTSCVGDVNIVPESPDVSD